MKSKRRVKHDPVGKTSPEELTVGDALKDLLSRLEKIRPTDGMEHALLFRALLRRIRRSANYFRESPVGEREDLRRLTLRERKKLGEAATEARQLMREEQNYQDWIKMNQSPCNISVGDKIR